MAHRPHAAGPAARRAGPPGDPGERTWSSPDRRRGPAPLARSTDGRSGADLALVCEQAAEAALAASIQSGTVQPIRQEDLAWAIRLTRPSNRPWPEAARHHAMYADAGGDYAELLAYLQRRP
ncbi:MAG: hypothetical protein U0P45_01390 [Acidimicrobiales bacterium]